MVLTVRKISHTSHNLTMIDPNHPPRTRATVAAIVLLSVVLVAYAPTASHAMSTCATIVGIADDNVHHPTPLGRGVIVPRGVGGVVRRRRGRSMSASATTAAFAKLTSSSSSSSLSITASGSSSPPPSSSTSSSSALVEGLKSTLASGLAAACSKTILAPFDTIKTVQQASAGTKSMGMIEAGRLIASRPGGLGNLYAGLAVSALGSMPSVGLYFGVYSYCKRTIGPTLSTRLGSERGGNTGSDDGGGGGGRREKNGASLFSDAAIRNFSIACSAAIGNTVASFSRVPYEVVKQSLQTGQYPSTYVAMSTMWRDGGMRSFFPLGGVSIQMVRDIPYAIFTLLSYEYIKERWVIRRSLDDPDNRWLRDMAAGATAGGIGSYLTNPFDVVKTRLQTTTTYAGSSGGGYGGSIANCAAAIYEEGGPSAFLRGSVPRLMHKIPANGLFFVFYEFFKRVLNA